MRLVHETGVGFSFSPFVVINCRPGEGAKSCRYLVGDITGGAGLHCAKFVPELAQRIDARCATGTFVAVAINCPGRHPEEVL
jgi:hypothetical protein